MSFIAKDVSTAPQPTKLNLCGIEAELRRMGVGDEAVKLIVGLLETMAAQNQALQVRLETALRQLWNRKSEKVSPEQLALFLAKLPDALAQAAGDAQGDAQGDAPPDGSAKTDPPPDGTQGPSKGDKPPPRRPQKLAFPEHLPRRREDVRVADDDRPCASCGAERTCIGHEIQNLWEFEPGYFFLLQRFLEKLACKKCEEEGVTTAPAPGKPIEGARPGPGLLAQIVTAKEHDSQPLYRQSQIYERSGIHLAPSTLGDWHAAAADLYEPIYEILKAQTLAAFLLSLDDTGMPVLDRDDARGISKGHLWTYIANVKEVAFCAYTKTWEGEAACAILKGCKARFIQADAYAGIGELFTGPDPPRRVGCHDHSRRKFVHAMKAGDGRAALVVQIYAGLYAVEADARKEGLAADALLVRRQEKSQPIFDRLHRVIADLHGSVEPKSHLGKATGYAIRQWPTLSVFLEDGRVPIANIHVERQQRKPALGRKNWLFAGSHEGARRLAILQTIVVNCDLAGISMWHYLRDVFRRIADRLPRARYAELTPAAWAAAQKSQQTNTP